MFRLHVGEHCVDAASHQMNVVPEIVCMKVDAVAELPVGDRLRHCGAKLCIVQHAANKLARAAKQGGHRAFPMLGVMLLVTAK